MSFELARLSPSSSIHCVLRTALTEHNPLAHLITATYIMNWVHISVLSLSCSMSSLVINLQALVCKRVFRIVSDIRVGIAMSCHQDTRTVRDIPLHKKITRGTEPAVVSIRKFCNGSAGVRNCSQLEVGRRDHGGQAGWLRSHISHSSSPYVPALLVTQTLVL